MKAEFSCRLQNPEISFQPGVSLPLIWRGPHNLIQKLRMERIVLSPPTMEALSVPTRTTQHYPLRTAHRLYLTRLHCAERAAGQPHRVHKHPASVPIAFGRTDRTRPPSRNPHPAKSSCSFTGSRDCQQLSFICQARARRPEWYAERRWRKWDKMTSIGRMIAR